ncbi:MAG TPA: hypothetical protein VG917_03395 [Patescibacteria group bacterium]|nr:hypothetical protein [Patescibacteria group bacterium]
MNNLETLFVVLYGSFSFSGFLLGLKNCVKKKNPYGLTKPYNLIGSFVWADAIVFGLFWTMVSIASILLSNWLLFLLTQSIFWLIRSIGETIYWFNEQFAVKNRNPVHTLWHSKIFPGSSSYIASQIFWQCIAVITSITSLFLIKVWFKI